ncbi:DUF3035 domain-containing protein [Sandarakinorhabdus sp. DWP1-3-1]|uniref:DUF3035 domain-containing protein n=1 Tax=Sandarakinorhabdus sp. DWP1-3-1 TaxID=2804627 RepID=UPI003CFAD6AE
MRNILVICGAAMALAACGKSGLAAHNAPDELAISRNAPLVVPQDFALTPPRPGAPRAAGQDAQGAAMEALFGPGVKVPPKSPAEQQLLDRAGAAATDPSIRSQAGDPQTPTVNKGAFLRELMDAPAATRNAEVAAVTAPN